MYDIIIVGGGPAGLTAALYSSRRTLSTLIISKDLGGQASISFGIENYPGVDIIDGLDLMQRFAKQAEKFGATIKYAEVTSITQEEKTFVVSTPSDRYTSRAVILACGLTPRDLKIPGEKEYIGRGVSYCATCDAPLYKKKTVAVIGGGNSALEAAELLSKIADKVYLVHRRDQFRGEEVVLERVKNATNVEMILSSQVLEIRGDKVVRSVIIKKNGGDETSELNVDGIFVEIGYVAKTEFIKDLVQLNSGGEVLTDKDGNTSRPGVFSCGDVTDTTYKQVVISAGEGAKAALQAYKFLCLETGAKILPDWQKKQKSPV